MNEFHEREHITGLLVIDIGGSKIKWQKLDRYGLVAGKGEVSTESTEQWLLNALGEIDQMASPAAVLMGVPGPVRAGEEVLVLPPLRITTSKTALKRCFKNAKTKIVNDAVLVAMVNEAIKSGRKEKGTGLSLTIGTSLGSTLMTGGNQAETCRFIPMEMAHLKLETKDWEWTNRKEYFRGKNASCLYSVYGLIMACRLPVSDECASSDFNGNIVRLEEGIVRREIDYLDKGKVESWIKSLCGYCSRLLPDLNHLWVTGKIARRVLLQFDLLGEVPRRVAGINVSLGTDLTTDHLDLRGIMIVELEE